MKIYVSLLFLLCISKIVAQKEDSLKNFDFLNHDYEYLDSSYNIVIDSSTFNETVSKYKYIRDRIDSYKDSLSIALMSEFGDWKKSRMAELRLTYSWQRVGHHLWKKEDEIIKIGKELKLEHPYKLQKLFYNPNGNVRAEMIIDSLRNKLISDYKLDTLKTMTNKSLMTFAFNRNPDVLQLKKDIIHRKNIDRFVQKHGRPPNDSEKEKLGLSCGKENCCQL